MRAALFALLLLPALADAQMLGDAAVRLRSEAYLKAWTTPIGQPVKWRDLDSGDHGRITPLREHKIGAALCRDMTESLTVRGEPRQGAATGCRDAQLNWHVVSATPGSGESDNPAPAEVPADLPPYQPPADISADPPRNDAMPGLILRVRPPGGRNAAVPDIYLAVPPPPAGG